MTEPKAITFEKGYLRLQEIAEEVNRAEVPVDRMGDLFAEGKGLEKALTDHLEGQKARMERIERGDEIQAFRIISESEEKGEVPGNGFGPGDGVFGTGDIGTGGEILAGGGNPAEDGSSGLEADGKAGDPDDQLPF